MQPLLNYTPLRPFRRQPLVRFSRSALFPLPSPVTFPSATCLRGACPIGYGNKSRSLGHLGSSPTKAGGRPTTRGAPTVVDGNVLQCHRAAVGRAKRARSVAAFVLRATPSAHSPNRPPVGGGGA